MGKYRIVRKASKDLTLILFSGNILFMDLINAIDAFYQTEISSKVICIFTRCEPAALSNEDLSDIAMRTCELAHLRPCGKTAFVCRDDLAYGLGRMFITNRKLLDNPIRSEVFRTTGQAIAWLNS